MSPDDIIHHMACDISQCIDDVVPAWPFPGEPADAYTDAVCAVFGDAPTEQSVLDAWRKGKPAEALRDELNDGAETDIVTLKAAEMLVRIMIVNNFGPEAVA